MVLGKLQRGERVPRGTLQMHWSFKTYDEARLLGLTEAAERSAHPHPRPAQRPTQKPLKWATPERTATPDIRCKKRDSRQGFNAGGHDWRANDCTQHFS